MALEDFKRPQRKDHREIPEEIWRLIDPMSRQLENLTREAQRTSRGKIETRTLQFNHGVAQPIELQSLRGGARSLRVISTGVDATQATPSAQLHKVDEKNVEVTLTWPTDPGAAVDVVLDFEGY